MMANHDATQRGGERSHPEREKGDIMEDLIKREDAIKAIAEPFTEELWDGVLRSIRDVVAVLKDIPSADKQGEWITEEINSIYGLKIRLKCSECGDIFDVSEKAFPYERFCRYCGCRMKGADDE